MGFPSQPTFDDIGGYLFQDSCGSKINGNIGLIYGRYLQFRFLRWPVIKVSFFGFEGMRRCPFAGSTGLPRLKRVPRIPVSGLFSTETSFYRALRRQFLIYIQNLIYIYIYMYVYIYMWIYIYIFPNIIHTYTYIPIYNIYILIIDDTYSVHRTAKMHSRVAVAHWGP